MMILQFDVRNQSAKLSPLSFQQIALAVFLFLGAGVAMVHFSGALEERKPYRYSLDRVERGKLTQDLNREIGFYRQRLQQDTDSGLNRALLAHTYLKMARATGETSWYLLAEQTAQESLAKLPFNNDSAVLALARVALAKHDFQQAIQMAEKVDDQSTALPTLVAAHLAIGNLSSARQQTEMLVSQGVNLGSLSLRGLVAFAQGQDQAAIADFQKAISLEEAGETGGSVNARTLLGRLYFKRGQLDTAEQLYRESLRILPDYAPALLNLAELQIRRGDYAKAEQTYDRFFFTTRQSPDVYDHTALRGMARLKLLQANPQEVQQWSHRAEARLRQDMTAFGHRRELAQLLIERGRLQDLQEALALMQAELKIRQDSETYSTLAKVYSQLGQSTKAAQAMESALKSGIRDAGLFQQMGLIQEQLGNLTQAQNWFQQAKQVDPRFDKQAQNALGLGVGLLGLN